MIELGDKVQDLYLGKPVTIGDDTIKITLDGATFLKASPLFGKVSKIKEDDSEALLALTEDSRFIEMGDLAKKKSLINGMVAKDCFEFFEDPAKNLMWYWIIFQVASFGFMEIQKKSIS